MNSYRVIKKYENTAKTFEMYFSSIKYLAKILFFAPGGNWVDRLTGVCRGGIFVSTLFSGIYLPK